MSAAQKCGRCGRRLRKDLDGWNGTFRNGRIVELLCPNCQTVDENVEAVINEATLDYSLSSDRTQVLGTPKGVQR